MAAVARGETVLDPSLQAGLLDQVQVDYYGSLVPISQVANVSLLDARTISVQPWEKGMGAKIEKAIRESDLGLNPATQGDLIRVPMPPLTTENVSPNSAATVPPADVGFESTRITA